MALPELTPAANASKFIYDGKGIGVVGTNKTTSAPATPTLTIVIPALNEEARIAKTLDAYAAVFPHAELLVVINGTTDRTEDVVRGAERRHKHIRHVVFPDRIGKGGAVIEGFKLAKGELIGFTDADESTSPAEYKKLVDCLDGERGLDGAIASRRCKGARVTTYQPPLRLVAGLFFNLLVRALFWMPFKDTQCGAKLFRREPLLRVLPLLVDKGWSFDVSLLYELRRQKARIAEIPITWSDAAGSKLRFWHTSVPMFTSIAKLRLRHLPFTRGGN